MKSPFQFGTLATEENFVDRVKDRALLKQLLTSHINVMLISPRRWGKSTLVNWTMRELQREHSEISVCHMDAFSISSEAEFYRTLASRVIACTSSRFERWVQDAKKFLTGAVPQLVIKDDITDFMAFDVRFKPQEQDKIAILQLPETIAAEKGLHIIICIDEFQQLAQLPSYKDMEGKMRSVWQRQQHVTYCLYGSKRHMMMDIFNNANNPFYRFGQVVFLDKIAKPEWVPFIVDAFRKTGKKITEAQAEQICDTIECHTWYLQQLCFFIWNATPKTVTDPILQLGIKQTLNINTPMFQADTDKLSPTQVELLRAISHGEKQLSAAAVREKYNLGNPNTLNRNKKILQEQDVIELNGGQFHFVDPLYRIWFDRCY